MTRSVHGNGKNITFQSNIMFTNLSWLPVPKTLSNSLNRREMKSLEFLKLVLLESVPVDLSAI